MGKVEDRGSQVAAGALEIFSQHFLPSIQECGFVPYHALTKLDTFKNLFPSLISKSAKFIPK